jgi:hypothetical protein
MSIALGVLALLVAVASVVYARRSVKQATRSATAAEASAGHAKRSADASEESAVHAKRSADAEEVAIHDRHTPMLEIGLDGLGPEADVPQAYYWLRNDSQDLDEVIVHRPEPPDNITYWVGRPWAPGREGATGDHLVNLGALARTREVRFALFCGSNPEPPEFRVVVECRKGEERWDVSKLLPPPKPPA